MFDPALAGVATFIVAWGSAEFLMHWLSTRSPWPVSTAGHVMAIILALIFAILMAASVADAQPVQP